MTPDINTLRELLPAYAIGALEPHERLQVEEALLQFPELRAELEVYQDVADALLTSVPQMEPPPAMREAIMERASGGQAIRPLPARRGLLYGLVAAALVVMLVGVVFILTQSDDKQKDPAIASIMDNSGSRWVNFEGTEEFERVSGAFIIAPDERQGVLWVQNLAVLDETNAYQLWLSRGEDQRISGLVFQPDKSETWQLVDLPTDISEYVGFGVTIEPAGGSDEPTSSPVFLGALE
jgi:anti-sigma-K factor RskA